MVVLWDTAINDSGTSLVYGTNQLIVFSQETGLLSDTSPSGWDTG